MQQILADRFYYLANFEQALAWVGARYPQLLNENEQDFIARFPSLPQVSRALLARLVMRKGNLFRSGKLNYTEIGCINTALMPLVALGWVDPRPALTIDELAGLLTKAELAHAFRLARTAASVTKRAMLDSLRGAAQDARPFDQWWEGATEQALQVRVDPLCARLRLLFFGNAYQGWSEFVLADLGINRYEKVELSGQALGFRTREDVDAYLLLQSCRDRLQTDEDPALVARDVPSSFNANPWLESRRAKLLFRLAQDLERKKRLEEALALYEVCAYPGSRLRRIRILERLARPGEAWELTRAAQSAPESEAEQQQLSRILPRLRQRLGLSTPEPAPCTHIPVMEQALPVAAAEGVERALANGLSRPEAPVYYVENALLNSLFGLLCWSAIFAPVPGAFFHPFHTGPADLYSPDFLTRREGEFSACLARLEDGSYVETIRHTYTEKFGIVSPFVAWNMLDETLLELALTCIPPGHLKACFNRMLLDLRNNCAGLPDLIQFFPAQKHYRLIEVKAPGDRLQDNQIRWFAYFGAHGIPAAVCHVHWTEHT